VWRTELAVLAAQGSVISDRGRYLVVATPQNPTFHWGNFLLVLDPSSCDDAGAWVREFAACFPGVGHVALGLPAQPDPAPWSEQGLAVESELVLSMDRPPDRSPSAALMAAGYSVRRLSRDADWEGVVQADLADNRVEGTQPEQGFETYLRALYAARRGVSEQGGAAFFGAFTPDGTLVSRLGIVLCGPMDGARQVARYQHVGTDSAHRSRGLAGHLLGVAAAWAHDRGADRWEIHVDPGSAAHRLYSAVGFAEVGRSWQAYRAPVM
jgi:GNAT superfamily N-acetyltransferase